MPIPVPAVFISFLLVAAPAQAFQDGAAAPAGGLPAGGGLDPQRVTELRYGGAAAPQAAPSPTAAAAAPVAAPPRSTPASAPRSTPASARRAPIPGALATLYLERTGQADARQVPLTFGQVFAPGVLTRETRIGARLADGSVLPLQVDTKAFHDDGSVRHAIVSGIVPAPNNQATALGLVKLDAKTRAEPAPTSAVDPTPAMLVRSGLTANVRLVVDGKTYDASLDRLLAQGKPAAWLAGPIAHEWLVSAPLADRGGQQHPHLAARFAVRWYPALKQARVDVTIENNWAYEARPRNFTYDVELEVGGDTVYRKSALTHYHHARWRKLAWWGGAPAVHLRHDSRQLIDSRALPNYDPAIQVGERTLADALAKWTGPMTEPMGVGLALPAMPTTGGRGDIGLQPAWAVDYLLSMDRRARLVTMGTADLAGSWSIHYRDRRTGLPVSLLDFPYITVPERARDSRNPANGRQEALAACTGNACDTPNAHDIAHQPNFAYLPYLISGDHYYLEELQFWAMYDVFALAPVYRDNRKGLLKEEQVRGQAWGLRTLAEAAYITPDGHPLKAHFRSILDSNLDWYNAQYSHNPKANALGFIANGYAVVYADATAIAPWQDDFFTAAVGRVAELGFSKARPLLEWKARFPVARMTGKGACWVSGAMYSMRVRDSQRAPFYATIGEAFRKSDADGVSSLECGGAQMAAKLKLRPGEMSGYASSPTGQPSNMQPALAYAADALGDAGKTAWERFMARGVKPDYSVEAQFAIVPRND